MANALRQGLRQGQSIALTQQLRTAIKLLQMPNVEVADYVAGEIERNPLLEFSEQTGDEATPLRDVVEGASDKTAQTTAGQGGARAAPDDGPGPGMWREARQRQPAAGGDVHLDALAAQPAQVSLREHLETQLQEEASDDNVVMLVRYLVGCLDEAGYLAEPLDLIADRLGASLTEIERALDYLQSFDPPGVAARDLAECLRLQLERKQALSRPMGLLLGNLPLMASGQLDVLARRCGVNGDGLAAMLRTIRQLDPKPGLAFDVSPVSLAIPDIFVQSRNGVLSVELNNDSLPRVLVNRRYYAEVVKQTRTREDRQFLSECLAQGSWLKRALDQRANTILRVASEIVRVQHGFFEKGIGHLRPLTLKRVADALSLHESTISRVTSGKYLECERGIFELKYFFTAAIASATGEASFAAESVRERVRLLIDQEDARKPLSDDQMVKRLRDEGIDIARRTVTKYRESMGIPSSVVRRRLKSQKDQTAGQ